MSKRSRRPKSPHVKGRRPPRRSGVRASSRRGGEPDLIGDVAEALEQDDPLALLALTSSILSIFSERSPIVGGQESSLPSLVDLTESFFAAGLRETSALLAVVAELTGNDVLRHRVRQEIGARGHVLPRWLAALDEAEPVDRAVEMRHVLGDGENIVLGVRLPGGHELCAAVYIDHNLGTLVKDAFVVPGSLSELVDMMADTADDPDTSLTELHPAVARARIAEAMERSRITFPPIETETWPACRPLVEWAVGLLPAGGTGYVRPEWTDDDKQALADRFFASPLGAAPDDADHRSLLESLLWYATDYGPGDPLRWSPVAAEILLVDWIPRKIVADVPCLTKAPELLRAFIRFCHAERGIRTGLTAETLAAVDEYEPEYQATIRRPRPQGPAALLARIGLLDPDRATDPEAFEQAIDQLLLDGLRRAVGGQEALAALDADPLHDEPFDWRQVPDAIRERVAEVLELVDRCCAELFDVELRTAARRLLARVIAGDPDVIGGRGRTDTGAAAICWIVAKANDVFDDGGVTVKELLGWFGVGANTPSQRSRPMLKAIGVESTEMHERLDLGSPEFLTGATRSRIIAARERMDG